MRKNAKRQLLNAKLNFLYVFSTTFTPQPIRRATLVYVRVTSTSLCKNSMSYSFKKAPENAKKQLLNAKLNFLYVFSTTL